MPDQSNVWTDAVRKAKHELKFTHGITEEDISSKQLENLIIDKHMYQLTGHLPSELLFQYSNLLDEDDADLDHIKNYVSRWGKVPSAFTEWLGGWDDMNYDVESDREQLIEMAQAFNYVSSANLTKMLTIDGIETEDALMLTEFYTDWQKRKAIIDRSGNVPEDEKITESEFVQRWWQTRDKKRDEIDLMNQEIDKAFTRLDEGFFEAELLHALQKTSLDIFAVSYGTVPFQGEPLVKPLINWPILRDMFVVSDNEKIDLNLRAAANAVQQITPDIIMDYYKAKNLSLHQIQMRTKQELSVDINKIIKWAIRDIANMGYDTE